MSEEDKIIMECLKDSGYKIAPIPVRKKQFRVFFCKNCGLHVEGFYRSDKIYCDDCGNDRREEIIKERSNGR